MPDRTITEHVELGLEERWAYYRRYFDVASRFHGAKERVVHDAEVQRCIRSLKTRPEPRVRQRVPLVDWRHSMDSDGRGLQEQYFALDFDDRGWDEVRVPHTVNHVPPQPVRYGSTRYPMIVSKGRRWDIWKADSMSWYRASVAVPRLRPGQVAYLGFDSINLLADVWVNEDPVMIGHLGLFPFRMEVSEEVDARDTERALIAVRVTSHATNTPYLFYNGLQQSYARPPWSDASGVEVDSLDFAWSGIAGASSLEVMNRVHLDDAFLTTETLAAGRARLRCRLAVRNESFERFRGHVRVEVGRWTPAEEEPRLRARIAVDVPPVSDGAVEATFEISDPAAWTVESPSLYLAHVVLEAPGGSDLDDLYRSFGIRTVELRGSSIFLNGSKVVPRGTHDLSNYHGESLICPSDTAIVKDILLHKGMNAVCSRWPSDMRVHYPRIAEFADQLGYMISWTGYFEMWNIHPEAEIYAARDVKAMVRSLRNHPSIIAWEMGDEPLMLVHHHRRWRWYESIYDAVEREDRSRPIIPAGAWSNELVELLQRPGAPGETPEAKKERLLVDFPLFARDLAVWDYHYCPYHPGTPDVPTWKVVGEVREAFAGLRPSIFTEFGIDGMPRFENVRHIYGTFRWKGNGLMPLDRNRSDTRYFGRPVTQEDWQETQAAQAITMAGIITQLRESPEVFSGYYLVTLVDPWTFTWGVVDAAYNAKLAYHVVKECYGPVFVTGTRGSAVIRTAEGPLHVTASTYGPAVSAASLEVTLRNEQEAVVEQGVAHGISLTGDVPVDVTTVKLEGLPAGTYAAEYELRDAGGAVLARRVEVFILRT
jgi:hypothetical protein